MLEVVVVMAGRGRCRRGRGRRRCSAVIAAAAAGAGTWPDHRMLERLLTVQADAAAAEAVPLIAGGKWRKL